MSSTMVRLQLNIFQLPVYSTKETVYHRLQLEMVAGEGGTVFPRLHSGRSGETATGDSTETVFLILQTENKQIWSKLY